MSTPERRTWTFLTNHTQVLLCIAQDSEARLRDIASMVGITERAAQRITKDLVESGIVERRRNGRRNQYYVNRDATMRHAAQSQHRIAPLLALLQPIHPWSGGHEPGTQGARSPRLAAAWGSGDDARAGAR